MQRISSGRTNQYYSTMSLFDRHPLLPVNRRRPYGESGEETGGFLFFRKCENKFLFPKRKGISKVRIIPHARKAGTSPSVDPGAISRDVVLCGLSKPGRGHMSGGDLLTEAGLLQHGGDQYHDRLGRRRWARRRPGRGRVVTCTATIVAGWAWLHLDTMASTGFGSSPATGRTENCRKNSKTHLQAYTSHVQSFRF